MRPEEESADRFTLDGQPGLSPDKPVQQQLMVLGAYEGLDAHAVLVDGHWPAPGQAPATGQLDSETGRSIMALLRAIVDADGVTAVVATHDPLMLESADRVVELRDGRLIEHR